MNSFSLRTNGKYPDPPSAPKVSIHRSICYSQRNEFSTSCWFFNLPDLNIIQFCIFFPWIRLSNGGVCWVFIAKSLCFLYFPLWPVCHFKNSQRRACSSRGVSGRVHLETRKTNVRRAGERVWYVTASSMNSEFTQFFYNYIIKKRENQERLDMTT